MRNNFSAKLNEARQKLPLKSLMERRGRGPTNGKWKSFPKCPYCEGKGTAGVFAGPHGDLFKCHRTSCPSGTPDDGVAWDEIGFLAFELNCDRRVATRHLLEEAGLWNERFNLRLKLEKAQSEPLNSGKRRHPSSQDITNERSETNLPADTDEVPNEVSSKSPLLAFYESLTLSDADREELKTKRGLTDEMIDACGFRTNCQANLEILQSLVETYDERALVRCGLWISREKHSKPSGQFYGYGVVGKKKRLPPELLESGDYAELEDDDFVWDWKESGKCNPIIIPDYDLKEELIAIRPHKGFPRGQQPRLYLAGGTKAVKECKRAVIVEGEFKAAALQSIVGSNWAVASVPGITQVKNLDVWGDILGWLKALGAREVVVAFDNEEQGDPALPSFRPLLQDCFEAEVWARVCAVRLMREGYEARVAHLPDEWRNASGKADWDSALAALLRAGKPRSEIAILFERVMQDAQTPAELAKAKPFGAEAEQSIKNRVELRTYEPALPCGGDAERRVGKLLRRLAATSLRDWSSRILPLAEAYEKTAGWYYEFRLSEQRREKLQSELFAAEGFEQIKFLKLALKGTPTVVAPFRLIPCYVLVKPDGSRDRLVKLRNVRGECSGLVALDSDSFTAPRDFRRWLSRMGNYSWQGGERALQALQQNIDFALAYREVRQLICYGCERPGGLWVLDDCAYADDGSAVLPDQDEVFWHLGKGYKFLRDLDRVPQGEEGQSFRMKSAPAVRPNEGLLFDSGGKLCLMQGVPDDPAAVQELLGSLVTNLNESYGGYDGAMLVGGTLAFFAAPQLFRDYGQFPGIWITGEKGSGKTFTAKWLMALHGLSGIEAGISFKTSSAVGVQIAMGQYANIPVWGDEYKETELRDSNIKGVAHSGFNRELPSKWSSDGRTRSIRSNLIVTGETTCTSAATMSRFVSVAAAREKRAGTSDERARRLEWLVQHRPLFFVIGRAVLRQRAKFARRLMDLLKEWELSPELSQVDPRGRYTHGVSYSALIAINEIIPVFDVRRCADWRQWMIRKTLEGDREVSARVDVNQFWMDLLSALKAGAFGTTPADIQRFFKVTSNAKGNPPLTARQLKDSAQYPHLTWKSYSFYFTPGPVIDALRIYKRTQGQVFPLDQNDLLTQLRVRPYFLQGPRQGHAKKFGKGSRSNQYCWGFDLDKFEALGFRLVSDEEWEQSFYPDGDTSAGLLPAPEWVDPRKGELFLLVDALEDRDA